MQPPAFTSYMYLMHLMNVVAPIRQFDNIEVSIRAPASLNDIFDFSLEMEYNVAH